MDNSKGICQLLAYGIRVRKIFNYFIFTVFCILLSSCAHIKRHDGPPSFYVDETKIHDAVPKPEPLAKFGNMPSYVVSGKRYYTMKSSKNYEAVGTASWYGTLFHARRTSSGEPYDMLGMTAAHKTLPLPTYVEVTNLKNQRTIIVKVNDRGPFKSNRLIDLSYVAAKKLGMLGHGTAQVKIKAIDPSTWGHSNDFWLASNKVNPHEEFASNTPLKRTYTYYLQGSHKLGGSVTAENKHYSRSSLHVQHRSLYVQNTSFGNAHHRLARHTKSRVLVASNSRSLKHHVRKLQTGQTQLVYLQVGAFRNKLHAQKLQQRLDALLETPVNISHPSAKGNLYHVRVGPIKDVATAKRLTHRLRGMGIKSNRV